MNRADCSGTAAASFTKNKTKGYTSLVAKSRQGFLPEVLRDRQKPSSLRVQSAGKLYLKPPQTLSGGLRTSLDHFCFLLLLSPYTICLHLRPFVIPTVPALPNPIYLIGPILPVASCSHQHYMATHQRGRNGQTFLKTSVPAGYFSTSRNLRTPEAVSETFFNLP